ERSRPRLFRGRKPEPAQAHAATLHANEGESAGQRCVAHAMKQSIVSPERKYAGAPGETEARPGEARRIKLAKDVLVARKIGAPLVGEQMVRIGRLIDAIGLVHLRQQAGAGLEAGLEREVDAVEAHAARQAALDAGSAMPARLDDEAAVARPADDAAQVIPVVVKRDDSLALPRD